MKTINKIIQILVVAIFLPIVFTGCSDDDNEITDPGTETEVPNFIPVSYTHLDVYKRQPIT